jgi:hypothetical protein
MRQGEKWWRAVIAFSAVLMAIFDAVTPVRSHFKVEAWVVLFFLDLVATIFLLSAPFVSRHKLKLVGWLVGSFGCLYSFTWVLIEQLTRGFVPTVINLYPFEVTVSVGTFVLVLSVGALVLYACKGD